MRRPITAVTVAVLLAGTTTEAQSRDATKFVRYAHIANDGRIAFTYADDIWVSDGSGANPRRLTAHVARDFMPRFSPDGAWIVFTSNRTGNNDVFVVPSGGGEPRQLTWHSGDDQALYFSPDGASIVMTSARGQGAWGSPLFRLPLDGTIPTPFGMDIGRAGMIKQDATAVAFNRVLPTYWRKGYRGNNSGDIAIQDLRSGDIREITDTDLQSFKGHANDVHPMWGADGKVYFASERDGNFNIWRVDASGSGAQQVTRHSDDGVQFPAMSPDGRRLIYENNFELWTLDVPTGESRRVPITLAFDPKENDEFVVTANNRADGFSISPDGSNLAVDFHGEIVIVPVESGIGDRIQVTNSPWRERNQAYSPDGRRLAYVSDESGEEEVWVTEIGTGTRRKLTTHESVKSELSWSPNSRTILYTAANRLFEVDADGTGAPRELGFNQAGGYLNTQYAGDGSWVVYVKRDDDQNADVFAMEVATKREHNLTQSPFNENGAQVTPDGRTLVFTSNRDNGTTHLFAVSLAKLTEDPSDPLVRARRNAARGDSTSARATSLRIDVAGMSRRAVQLTRGEHAVSGFFISRDGRTVYFSQGAGGGFGGGQGAVNATGENPDAGLYSVTLEGRDRRRVVQGVFTGMQPSLDRRTVFFRHTPRGNEDGAAAAGFEVHKVSIANPQRAERVSFAFPVRVDRRAEWNQMFEESWRVMKYRFYDEKMHGYDWNAIRSRYKPLLRHVGTNEDLYDLTNEMIGELNASHTGVSGPPTRPMPDVYRTRFLGFEIEPANGRYRVSHIYRDGPADREWIGLAVGDYVLAIDGTELRAGDNYWKLLSTTVNEYIPVRYAKSPTGEGAQTVRIASVTSLTDIRYEEWVARNRDEVTATTNGDIAYVHIRSMNQPSLARFRNEIDQYSNAKGIIVDIRYNGGGNIDQELIDILERRPYQFWNNRTGSRTWGRRPRQAIAGPKVMLVNHRSGSDSEVTPMAFRQLGLGRIVGNPTAAAVIATGSYALINGGSIRTPGSLVVTYDPTKPNNYGVNLENLGVPPDVWVENSPNEAAKRVDRELKVAIEEAMKMLRATSPRVSQ